MKRLILLSVLLLAMVALFGQAIPPGLPSYRIVWHQDTAICNYMFITTDRFVLPTTLPSTAMIIDRRGFLVWYATAEDNIYTFGPQANGKLAFNVSDTWYELDATMNPVLQNTCTGAGGDFHDFIHLANGETFGLCADDTIMDLSDIHTYNGQVGDAAATVRYAVIEQRNAAGNLMKRWRGIDHFAPTDTDSLYFFYPWFLELNHTNSMEFDGRHLLLSHRNIHEVTLVDWPTGNVTWRLGGPNSDFYFLNDGGFKSQHDARFAGTGRISLFDNRTVAAVKTPRAVLYMVDTTLGLATKIYDRVDATIESPTMGSFRILSNGDGIVSWGNRVPVDRPSLTYFHPNGFKVCDIHLEEQHHCYQAVCEDLPFAIVRPEIYCDQQNGQLILQAVGSYADYLWSNGATTASIVVPDTGFYQLYVPLGMGQVGSNVIEVTNLQANCPSTPSPDAQEPSRPARLQGTYDLLGRPVDARVQGQLYIERYQDGRSRKLIQY